MAAGQTESPVRKELRFAENAYVLLAHARRLEGLSLDDILRELKDSKLTRGASEGRGKFGAGMIIEACFGIPPNSSSEPDFPRCGVELKTLPLVKTGSRLRVKERTSISLIDYNQLVGETWETASVRPKLREILFVFVVMDHEVLGRSRVIGSRLWSPDDAVGTLFELDWTTTHDRVAKGEADKLSERDSWALAASRKGAGNVHDLVSQPRSGTPALRRAFALKPCFTTWAFSELLGKRPSESIIESIIPEIRSRGFRAAEDRVVGPLLELEGKSLEQIRQTFHIESSEGKNIAANVIKRALGFQRVNSRIREFDQLGIEVRVLSLREGDLMPWESVSFPSVDLVELAGQDWEASDLASQLRRILFVPTYSKERRAPQLGRTLGRSFFWSPSPSELITIEQEWTMFRNEVSMGKAVYDKPAGVLGRRNRLTPASQTKAIHMRPHGRDAKDEYLDPRGQLVTRQCFWLNKKFVQRIVREDTARSVRDSKSRQHQLDHV